MNTMHPTPEFDAATRKRVIGIAFALLGAAYAVDVCDRQLRRWRAGIAVREQRFLHDLEPRGSFLADAGMSLLDALGGREHN